MYLKKFSLPGKSLIPKLYVIVGTFSRLLEVFGLVFHPSV